jgi:Ca2+-binding EF-hand superfamily protein
MSQDVIGKVRVEVAKRRLRIQDQFADFDKLRSGQITADRFRRCLTQMGCPITDADLAQACALFPGRDAGTVNYQAFMNAIAGQEAPLELLSSLRAKPRALSESVEAHLESIHDLFAPRIVSTGMDLRLLFKDFDKHNSGKITLAQFERCFPFRIDPEVLNALKTKYTDGLGSIMYIGWCTDVQRAVDRFLGSNNKKSEESKCAPLSVAAVTTADDVVNAVRQQLVQHKLRVEDAIKDFDKTHTGFITLAQLASALGRMKFVRYTLTEKDLALLFERYGSFGAGGVQRINYVAFLADVGPYSPHTQSLTGTSRSAVRPHVLGTSEESLTEVALEKVRNIVKTCRINLKPMFHDFDRTCNGIYQQRVCTASRFKRVLTLNKVNLTADEAELLVKKYSVASAAGDTDVNYYAFCCDVASPDVFDSPSKHRGTSPNKSSERRRVALRDVLDKIMSVEATRHMRLSEFMRDFDPLRSGIVQKDKFCSALNIAGLSLNADELELLVSEYSSEKVPQHVNITRFLADTDTGVTITDVAAGTLDRTVELRQRLLSKKVTLPDDKLAQLNKVIERVATTIRTRNILLPPFFHDYDRHHSGRITCSQFTQCMARHCFPVSEQDVKLLCDVYNDPNAADMVLWKLFVGDVDESENVSLQHTLRCQTRKAGVSPPRRAGGSSSETAEQALAKIASCVQRRNVRLEEFFHDADTLRHGFVTDGRFRSALTLLGIELSETELEALAQRFKSERNPSSVEYHTFLKDAYTLVNTRSFSPNRTQRAPVESSAALETLKREFRGRRLYAHPKFQDFDPLRKGKVTESQFFSVLTALGVRVGVGADAAAIRKAFSDGQGAMDYELFCSSVEA